MFRLRLAHLTLASGLLIMLSGCMSNSCGEREPLFSGLFNRSSRHPMMSECGTECGCQHGAMSPQTFDVPPGSGPFLGPPPAPMPGAMGPSLPPIVTKQAAPTPYTP
jgi:hypothetical protein